MTHPLRFAPRRKFSWLGLALVLFMTACSSATIEQPAEQPADMKTFVSELPVWPSAVTAAERVPLDSEGNPTADGKPQKSSDTESSIGSDSKEYTCTTTNYSLTNAPDEIVTFDPDTGLLWPGSILEGKGIQEGLGSFAEVSVKSSSRPALVISIPRILTADNRRIVPQPSQSTVSSAVGDLISIAKAQGIETGSKVNFTLKDSYSWQQSALDLNLAVEYLTGEADASLNVAREVNEHTITAYFVENAFTVVADLEGQTPQEALFGSGFSQSDLDTLIAAGQIGSDNLPTYIKSVSYGRILMFSVTSSRSYSEINAAVNAMYDFGSGTVSGGISASDRQLLEESEINVTSIGGPFKASASLIKSGDLSKFFSVDPTLETMVPISYEARTVKGNKIASVNRTTEYNIKECTQVPDAPAKKTIRVDFKEIRALEVCDGILDGTSEFYIDLKAFGSKVATGIRTDLSKGDSASLSGSLQRTLTETANNYFTVESYVWEDDSSVFGASYTNIGKSIAKYYAPWSGKPLELKTISGDGCKVEISYTVTVSDAN